jgi:hypothetical protein
LNYIDLDFELAASRTRQPTLNSVYFPSDSLCGELTVKPMEAEIFANGNM